MDKLSQPSESALAESIGTHVARPLMAYLRGAPDALNASGADSLLIAKTKLKASIAAMDKGDMTAASRLALSAYLDGFEPVEPAQKAKIRNYLQILKGNG